MKNIVILAFGLLAMGLVANFVWNTNQEAGVDSSTPPLASAVVRIGVSKDPVAWLALLAAEKGLFKDQGLLATVRYYPSGKRALQGLRQGDVDFATSAGSPISVAAFEWHDFVIISTLGSGDNEVKIVARRDHGINSPADLKGKLISTQGASAVHFFLDLFLLKYDLSGVVKQSFMAKEDLAEALETGVVDAVSTREPFLSHMVNRLSGNAIVFESPGLFRKSSHLMVRRDLVESHPEQLRAVLRALIAARTLLLEDPDQALSLIAKGSGISVAEVRSTMKRIDLRPRLNQSLLSTLEDSATWAMAKGIVKDQELPNYLDYINPGFLKELAPESVSITY